MKNYTPYSDLKIFYHTDELSKVIKQERVAPIYVRIKPTNICNQNCFYCSYADDRLFNSREVDNRESISWEIMKKTLLELYDIGTKAVTFSGGGEPLCYKNIEETFELVRHYRFDSSLITNGQALKGNIVEYVKHFKWVRISFDAANSDTYESVRKVPTYQQVIDNIANFSAVKDKECTLGINCVVTKTNAEEIFEICKLVKELGVNNIKLSPILVKENESEYHGRIKKCVEEQIVRAKNELEDDTFAIVDKYTNDLTMNPDFNKAYHRCWIQEFFCVIAADSNVYRCHQRAYMPIGKIGDLKQKSFKDIWYAKETAENVKNFDACRECNFRCAFEERNMLLDNFFNMDLNHVHFI